MYNSYLTNLDYNAGIYIRLSQEDKDKKYESDSESVINQKELLRGYVKNNNFNLIKEYVDELREEVTELKDYSEEKWQSEEVQEKRNNVKEKALGEEVRKSPKIPGLKGRG